MLESTLLPETTTEKRASTEQKKHSTNHQRSKDLLLRRESEERFLTRDQELMLGRNLRKLTLLMKSSSLNISKKRRQPRKPLIQLQPQLLKKRRSQHQPRLQPSQLRKRRKPQLRLLQLRLPLQPRRKNQRRLLRLRERNESQSTIVQPPDL